MSDLISRKELLKAFASVGSSGAPSYVTKNYIQSVITHAPAIEQGEAVIDKAAYDGAREDLSIWKRRALEAEEKVRKYDQRIVDIGVIAMTPVTTPQQSQEQGELVRKAVGDALEEAAKICDDEAEGFYQRSGSLDHETNAVEFGNEHAREAYDLCKELAESIRALIKRNTEGVE